MASGVATLRKKLRTLKHLMADIDLPITQIVLQNIGNQEEIIVVESTIMKNGGKQEQ